MQELIKFFDLFTSVTTLIGLMAFVAAIFGLIQIVNGRSERLSTEKIVALLPEADRFKFVDDSLARYNIPFQDLTPDQKFKLLMEEMRRRAMRERRPFLLALAFLVIAPTAIIVDKVVGPLLWPNPIVQVSARAPTIDTGETLISFDFHDKNATDGSFENVQYSREKNQFIAEFSKGKTQGWFTAQHLDRKNATAFDVQYFVRQQDPYPILTLKEIGK